MIEFKVDIADQQEQADKLLRTYMAIENKISKLKDQTAFLTVKDVAKLTGWSVPTVLSLFRRPDFPACDLGQAQIVYAPAFHDFFMKRVQKSDYV